MPQESQSMMEIWTAISSVAAVVSAGAAIYAHVRANRIEAKQGVIEQIKIDLQALSTKSELKSLELRNHANSLFDSISVEIGRIAENADAATEIKKQDLEVRKRLAESELKGRIEPKIICRNGTYFLLLHNSGLGEASNVHITIRESANNNPSHVKLTRPKKCDHNASSIPSSEAVEFELENWGPVSVRADWSWINRNNDREERKNEVVPYTE